MAVVPEHHHVRLPAVPVLVFVNQGLAVQHVQDHAALIFGHALDVQRELRVDKNDLFASDGVHRHHRMGHSRIAVFKATQFFDAIRVGGKKAAKRLEVVDGFQARKKALPAVGQSFVHR